MMIPIFVATLDRLQIFQFCHARLANDMIDDFAIATEIHLQGLRTVYEPEAIAMDGANRRAKDEFRMRVRVIKQAMSALGHRLGRRTFEDQARAVGDTLLLHAGQRRVMRRVLKDLRGKTYVVWGPNRGADRATPGAKTAGRRDS